MSLAHLIPQKLSNSSSAAFSSPPTEAPSALWDLQLNPCSSFMATRVRYQQDLSTHFLFIKHKKLRGQWGSFGSKICMHCPFSLTSWEHTEKNSCIPTAHGHMIGGLVWSGPEAAATQWSTLSKDLISNHGLVADSLRHKWDKPLPGVLTFR